MAGVRISRVELALLLELLNSRGSEGSGLRVPGEVGAGATGNRGSSFRLNLDHLHLGSLGQLRGRGRVEDVGRVGSSSRGRGES